MLRRVSVSRKAEKASPSGCSRMGRCCARPRSPGGTIRGPTGMYLPGSPTTKRAWTTCTARDGRTAFSARCVVMPSGVPRRRRHPRLSGEQCGQHVERVDAVLGGCLDVGANLGQTLGTAGCPAKTDNCGRLTESLAILRSDSARLLVLLGNFSRRGQDLWPLRLLEEGAVVPARGHKGLVAT